MNPLAHSLNEQIAAANPHVADMLSDLGANLFFPKGILSQSAEAKSKAHLYNATIGTAMEAGIAMNLESVMAPIAGVSPNEALLYAPSGGVPELRKAWQDKILTDNPSLQGVPMSLPVVTSGLTHGLSLLGDLFVDEGDVLLLPDKLWGNYRLIFGLRRGADIRTFPFFAEAASTRPPSTARSPSSSPKARRRSSCCSTSRTTRPATRPPRARAKPSRPASCRWRSGA
jgi:aspartate/methionine/tyrosine aminotransferase